jgi:hypothetical protein
VPDADIDVVLRTFHRSFPHAMAWATEDDEIVLIGSLRPFERSAQEIAERVAAHAPDLSGRFGMVRSGDGFDQLVEGPINTDDRPFLEFRNARHLLTGLKSSG